MSTTSKPSGESPQIFRSLTPPYSTIVADPPWDCRRPRFGWDSWGKGYESGLAS